MGKSKKKKQTKVNIQMPGCGFGCRGCLSFTMLAALAFMFLVFLVYNWGHVWQLVTTGVW